MLENKVLFITGGASGIGKATAELAVSLGGKVAILDKNLDGIIDGPDRSSFHNDVIYFRGDAASEKDVKFAINKTAEIYGQIDLSFNNVGILGDKERKFHEYEITEWEEYMRVNFYSVCICLKYEILHFLERGQGVIVNNASISGLRGSYDYPIYAATKHAVVGLTKSLAKQYAGNSMRINAVCPSTIDTPMTNKESKKSLENTSRYIDQHPMKRLGRAGEVAQAVIWLLSDRSSYVNGHSLVIDGGLKI